MGWVDRYNKDVSDGDDVSYPYLSGHYQGLLEDVIEVVGDGRLVSLVVALDRLERHRAQVWHDSDVAAGAPTPYPAPKEETK